MIKKALVTPSIVVAAAALPGGIADAQPNSGPAHDPRWTENVPPFRIADRLYYVGSQDIGVYLFDGGQAGLILIDAGMPDFAPQVLKNVGSLGFDPARIRILLNSQAHVDHAGGLAAIKRATGARMMASHEDAALLERGGKGDFQWGDELPYPAVNVDAKISDRQIVSLGSAKLTAHLMPGHTKGCTTWTLPVRIDGRMRTAQFVCGASAPGYRLLGNPAYPNIVQDFRQSFAKMRSLGCDLFLGAHGSYYDLDGKRAKLAAGSKTNPFLGAGGCRLYADMMEKRLNEQLARERPAQGVVQK